MAGVAKLAHHGPGGRDRPVKRAFLLMIVHLGIAAGGLQGQDLGARADSAWSRGDNDAAIRLYNELLSRDSSEVVALHRVGLVTAWNEQYDEALELLGRAHRLAPERIDLALDRARVLGWSQRYNEAIDAVTQVLTRDPDHFEALAAKARYASWAGRYDEAVEVYDRLITEAPDSVSFRMARAQVLSWAGDWQEAEDSYRAILATSPENLEARLGLARVVSWQGEHESARAVYEEILETDPDNEAARRGLAQVATWSGRRQEGERRWRELLERNPEDISALVGLAANLNAQGRAREGLQILERAENLAPNDDQTDEIRTHIERALAPRTSPSAVYVSDSDGNGVLTLDVNTIVPLLGSIELRVGAGRGELEQDGRPELGNRVVRGNVGLGGRLGKEWTLNADVGLWESKGVERNGVLTFALAVSPPDLGGVGTTFTLRRTAYDVTALVVNNEVTLREIGVGASVRPNSSTAFSGSLAGTWFEGSDVNRRILGSARASYDFLSWLRGGVALRAFTFEKEQRELNDGYWSPSSYENLELPVRIRLPGGTLRPAVEVAPGVQRIGQAGVEDPWGLTFRAQVELAYSLGVRRQLQVTGVFANSSVQQLSPTGSDYQYRSIRLSLAWAF